MSLPRHFYNTADRKLSIALNKITEEEINTSAQSAIWKLESIIRHFKPAEHYAISNIEKAIEKKRLDIQKKHPENERIYILEGMLHERMNRHDQALGSYQTTRMHFQHCWHAYLYPAALLQNSQRYEESKNLLIQMSSEAEKVSTDAMPSKKLTKIAKSLLTDAEQKLEEQNQSAEKQAQVAQIAEKRRLAKEMKKVHTLEDNKVQRQFEIYKQHPSYNSFNFLSDANGVWDKIKSIDVDNTTHTKNHAKLANKHGIFASENKAATAPMCTSKHTFKSGKTF